MWLTVAQGLNAEVGKEPQSPKHFLPHRINTRIRRVVAFPHTHPLQEKIPLPFFFPSSPKMFLITCHYIKPREQSAAVPRGDLEEAHRRSKKADPLLLCFARGWDRASNNCSHQPMNQSRRWLQ